MAWQGWRMHAGDVRGGTFADAHCRVAGPDLHASCYSSHEVPIHPQFFSCCPHPSQAATPTAAVAADEFTFETAAPAAPAENGTPAAVAGAIPDDFLAAGGEVRFAAVCLG